MFLHRRQNPAEEKHVCLLKLERVGCSKHKSVKDLCFSLGGAQILITNHLPKGGEHVFRL